MQNLPAALTGTGTEIYFYKDDLYAIYKHNAIPFNDWPHSLIKIIHNELIKDHEALKILEHQGLDRKIDQVWVYAKCRFGGFSSEADIEPSGKTNTEHWNCGCNGNCCLEPLFKHQIPVKNGHLTTREIEVLRQLANDQPGKVISANLGICEVTLDKHKRSLFNKTGCSTTLGLLQMAYQNSII